MQVKQEKSLMVTFLLWAFLGGIGGHRFYIGDSKGGSIMLALNIASAITLLFLIGFLGYFILGIWWMVDVFLLGKMVKAYNNNAREETKAFWEMFKK